jgi:hypothetical protein
LLALGAREDLQVRVSSCDEVMLDDEFETQIERGKSWDPARYPNRSRAWDPTGRTRAESAWEDPYDRFENRGTDREQNAYIRARLFMPVELTPEVMEEVRRDKSRRELISRVTGDSAAKENNPVWFPASWQPVALSRDSIGLEAEECELLHQMSSVFKDLGLRVTGKGRRCSRLGSSPVFTMEALLMDTTGDTALPQINVGGDLPQEGAPAAPAAPEKSDP